MQAAASSAMRRLAEQSLGRDQGPWFKFVFIIIILITIISIRIIIIIVIFLWSNIPQEAKGPNNQVLRFRIVVM